MLRRLQAGFTLVEVLVALAVGTTILGGMVASLFLIEDVGGQNTNRTVALASVRNAGGWLSRDVKRSATVTLGPNSGFPLTLGWTDSGGTSHTITYTLANGKLTRDVDGSSSVIARNIDEAGTSLVWDDTTRRLVATIAAVVGVGSSQEESASAVYTVAARPQ
jgi:prepilin-type N-terminal cleavage/methylation domain-containing protein